MLPILPKLEYPQHAEALTSLLLILKQNRYHPYSIYCFQVIALASDKLGNIIECCMFYLVVVDFERWPMRIKVTEYMFSCFYQILFKI